MRSTYPGYYQFKLTSHISNVATPEEIALANYLVEPRPDRNFKLTSLVRGQGLQTILLVQYTTSI